MTAFPPSLGEDHPRVCGEKGGDPESEEQKQGSPPRVRGKDAHSAGCSGAYRITPACAGKRSILFSLLSVFLDHPRVCGEKQVPPSSEPDAEGSPPRVRGKVIEMGRGNGKNGDHPRVCGEKNRADLSRAMSEGSPPRVRGKDSFRE